MEDQKIDLRSWTAPQLLRLNQLDGTQKHLFATEQGGKCRTTFLAAPEGGVSGGVPHTSGVCGPS